MRKPDLKRAVSTAERILAEYAVSAPPVPVEEIVTEKGLQVHYEPLEPNVSGVLVRKDGTAFVGVNALHHKNRQRFTLAHELAHYLLHPDQPTVFVDDALVHFRGDDMTLPADALEMEANAFAGALLMPASFLRADLAGRYIDAFDERAVRHLAGRYQVSPQALTIRLIRIGLLGGIAEIGGSGRTRGGTAGKAD